MSSYSELIKNFEKTRAYMRDFYVYGFKSREEYNRKSLRSYDDERRRVESWLGDHMRFIRTADGKNVFISIDSRAIKANPFYKALKAKSFTDIDITLHFVLFDILDDCQAELSLPEILDKISLEYLSCFDNPMIFDESTVRKKLKEYEREGIVSCRKEGRRILYKRSGDVCLPQSPSALEYFSEVLPCGAIGSFLLDKYDLKDGLITFKHHYITQALDSEVMVSLFCAMREKRFVTLENHGRRSKTRSTPYRLVPLKILISAQNGRQHLLAYNPMSGDIKSYRIDYISNVKQEEICEDYDNLRKRLTDIEKYIWGVGCKSDNRKTEHVEFTIHVGKGEEYIVNRLYREKRVGMVEKLDGETYRFYADVFDTYELVPWIRTFISRITRLNFSNRTIENQFKRDIEYMYKMYDIADLKGGDK